MNAGNRLVRLTAPLTVPLVLALTACGGGDSEAQTQAPANRGAIVIYAPTADRSYSAQTFVGKRLRAVLRVTGRAAPGQQLTLRGACGTYSCEGITFSDSDGRWRTRFELFTSGTRRKVKLSVGYADPRSGERAATVTVRVRKAAAPTQASPTRKPPSTASTGGTTAPAGGNPFSGPRTMILIGDSLAVGMAPTLRGALEGWSVPIDARTGRPLSEGMELLAETELPPGSEGRLAILAFSLGTNDGPANIDAIDAAVRESVSRLGANGCAIWATIARPPLGGVSYRAMNERLEQLTRDPALAGRLLIVPWAREFARHKSWQRPDGVHPTAEGAAARGQMYADAARSCAAR